MHSSSIFLYPGLLHPLALINTATDEAYGAPVEGLVHFPSLGFSLRVRFLIDTGAALSVISLDDINRPGAGRVREGVIELQAGQAYVASKGTWARYSSPSAGGAEYMSECVPAFAPGLANRGAG